MDAICGLAVAFALAFAAGVDGSTSSTMDNGIADFKACRLCVDRGSAAKDLDLDWIVAGHQHYIGQDVLLTLDEEIFDDHVAIAVVPRHKAVKDVSCCRSRRDIGRDLLLPPIAASAQLWDGNENWEHLADKIYLLTWISLIYPGNGAAREKPE